MKGSVRKRGNTYSYYFDIGKNENGKRRRKEKGGFKTKSEAESALRLAIYQFENGNKIVDESNISVAQYMNFWYEKYVLLNTRFRTQERYEAIIRIHINPYLGHYKLKNITSAILQEFFDNAYKNGYSKALIRDVANILRLALAMAVHPYQMTISNEMVNVRLKYSFKDYERDIISKEEVNIVLNFLKDDYYVFYVIYSVGYMTGMRISEVLGLQYEDVDLFNNVIYVRHQALWKDKQLILVEPKTNSSIRDISIGNTLTNILKEYLDYRKTLNNKSNFIFINSYNNPVTRSNVQKIKLTILKYTGVNIRFHDLRRLHGTLLCEANANMKGVQTRLGHCNLNTTMDSYVKKTKKIDLDTVKVFEELL
ncbi:site-specific integrase [Paraclostridium bifermentans]|uniref:Site-specific integrase n=1 Tax=Paraclostridium bifermentans TaxID=1490 RepID=A0A5P3XC84_PARBF|nr:site-specific integrase [Paraclostridium bifermentans]QEZ67754.1 site-specific integrase [Paraclostridium bifermentans]